MITESNSYDYYNYTIVPPFPFHLCEVSSQNIETQEEFKKTEKNHE